MRQLYPTKPSAESAAAHPSSSAMASVVPASGWGILPPQRQSSTTHPSGGQDQDSHPTPEGYPMVVENETDSEDDDFEMPDAASSESEPSKFSLNSSSSDGVAIVECDANMSLGAKDSKKRQKAPFHIYLNV
ncbi:hypothetical protein SEVIR_3G314700v4 [Setaria viridis]|uniref:Uncharacterized protein n=1 Tax=Setaria viridis TaxID=4556 RepID=A0A4U6VHS2_SETVI|nr:hypothetical protein SEVIR_3G314700v2 [Setaria viridis]